MSELSGGEFNQPSTPTGGGGREVPAEEELERYVFIMIGEQRLALHVDDVRTITELPMEPARVPRSTAAIEGLVDLRGEITAVIDPRTHFPVMEAPNDRGRLVVFDRPTDSQPAAMRVDEVIGVETVLEDDILTEMDEEALEHPLISALIRKTEETEVAIQDIIGPTDDQQEATDSLVSRSVEEVRKQSATDDFEAELLEEAGTDQQSEGAESAEPEPETAVELTALLDVDRFLVASGSIPSA